MHQQMICYDKESILIAIFLHLYLRDTVRGNKVNIKVKEKSFVFNFDKLLLGI